MKRERWPLRAYLIAVFGGLVLIVALATHLLPIAVFRDRIGVGATLYWSPPDRCFLVSPGTAVSWPAAVADLLRPSDCLVSLDGVMLVEHREDDGYLTRLLAQVPEGQLLTLRGQRDGRPLQVEVQALRLTLARLLEDQLMLLIPGMALWLTGWPVLFARPGSEGNRALALLLFLGALMVMTAVATGLPDWAARLHGWLFVGSGRPFLGALLFHLAFLFPEPPVRSSLLRWRLALYPPAVFAFIMGIGIYLAPNRMGDWLQPLHRDQNALTLSLFVLGSVTLFGRSFLIWRHSPAAQPGRQASLLLWALVVITPLVVMNLLFHDMRLPWFLPRVSNGAFVYWLIPAAALLAYAMLRYQTFAYRGLALNALIVLLASAMLTQIYSVFLAPRGWDGVQFATVWGAVLLTTLFWYVDSPVRRGFRRLFVRHEFDFQIAERFSQQMAAATSVDDALTRATRFLCDNLELAWVALSSPRRSQQLWLALADQSSSLPLQLAEDRPESHLPGLPAEALPISNSEQTLGTIWLGPRTTAEPVDDRDRQLVALLGQELARTLAVHTHIENLEQVPGRILAAVETDRNRIGQDLHDSVLQFLGAVPLELDRASQLVDRNPAQARAILDRTITQAEIVAQETRASVYDLSPPILLRQGILEAARNFAEQACTGHHVQLAWHVNAEAESAWQHLREAQAIQVYRILQQAVDNALTHAHPMTLTVQFDQVGRELLAEVIDDGGGFTTTTTSLAAPMHSDSLGLGLISMQARARALGGTLQLTSNPDQGTTVLLRFPYS